MTNIANPGPIGFIGLGQMGLPMAKNIRASGREVIGWSRGAEERAAFADVGGTVVERIGDLCHCPIVCSIVFDDAAVRAVALEQDGLIHALRPDAIHVAMETISPTLARELTEAYSGKGILHVTSPVFGPPNVAAAADLKINCSGPKAAFDRVEDTLATMGTPYWFGPEPEQGLMVKIMGNNMIFSIIETMHEALAFLRKGGISGDDAKTMLIERLFQSPIITGYAQMLLANPDAPPPFNVNPIPRKDNQLCLDMAEQLGLDMPVIEIVRKKIHGEL